MMVIKNKGEGKFDYDRKHPQKLFTFKGYFFIKQNI